MLLDRSGSMASYREQTIAAVNAYLASLRADKLARDTAFSLTIFDSESIDSIRRNEPGTTVRDLGPAEFQPRSATPLYDAIGHVLDIEGRTPVTGRKAIVIVTDGAENGSRRLKEAAVRHLVASREREGWIFIFLGANQNAGVEAAKVGVPEQRAISYRAGSGPSATKTFVAAAALSFTAMAILPGMMSKAEGLGFSEADRQAAFDGATDWESEMERDIAGAPSEPSAGSEPAAVNDTTDYNPTSPNDMVETTDSTDYNPVDSVSPGEAIEAGSDGGSIIETITDAIGSIFSAFGGGDGDSSDD